MSAISLHVMQDVDRERTQRFDLAQGVASSTSLHLRVEGTPAVFATSSLRTAQLPLNLGGIDVVSTIVTTLVMCVPSVVASPANHPTILLIDDAGPLSQSASQSQKPDQHRDGPLIEGDAMMSILLRVRQEMRKAASKTLRVTRWATQIRPDDPNAAWEDVSTGYLSYRQPSNYTLSLTTHPVEFEGGNDAESRTSCWVYDGREFQVFDGEHIKKQFNPPIATVVFDYLPLEWIFWLDPSELNNRYYVSLITERWGQATFYIITVFPRPSDVPGYYFNKMVIFVDVTTLLPRYVMVFSDTSDIKDAFYEIKKCTVSDEKEISTTDRVTKCNATRSAGRSYCIWNTKYCRAQRRSCRSARWHCRRAARCRW